MVSFTLTITSPAPRKMILLVMLLFTQSTASVYILSKIIITVGVIWHQPTVLQWWNFMDGCLVRTQQCMLNENSAPSGWWACTAPVSILPSTAAGPSSTKLLICRNSSGSSPPTTVKPKPRRLFFSFVLMKVPFSSAGFLVKKGFPPAEHRRKKLLPFFPSTCSTFRISECF